MAISTETVASTIVTSTGVVTVTSFDVISPDRVVLSLVRGSASAIYTSRIDENKLVDLVVRDSIVFPFTEP